MSALVESNKGKIAANKKALFNAECQVMKNKSNAYLARSLVNENQALINKNYNAAFLGNRQLANQNTEDLFRNRQAIMRAINSTNDVEKNFKEAMINRSKIEFLEHRSQLNAKVLAVTLEMQEVNARLIELNKTILATNEEIVNFNSGCIDGNSALLASPPNASQATPDSNAALIAENADRINKIVTTASANAGSIATVAANAENNRKSILENTNIIYERRARIQANAERIAKNQAVVADFIGTV